MKLNLVAVYDKRAREYSPPQAYITLGVAERAFSDAIKDTNSNLHRHPEDFNLQSIGLFDSETAQLEPNTNGPHILAEATAFTNL